MMLVLFGLLIGGLISLQVLAKTYASLPLKELRRRARLDRRYAGFYKLASFGASFELLVGLTSALLGLVLAIWLYKTAWWLALIGVLIGLWLARWRPAAGSDGWHWTLARATAPPLAAALSILRPMLVRLEKLWPGHQAPSTKLYEKEDLLELLALQKTQHQSRISAAELKIVHGALSFGDQLVGQHMVAWSEVKKVLASDNVGPHLMDELHKSGQTRFVVAKDKHAKDQDEILGTLFLRDLVEHADPGRVRDVMRPKAHFINEAQNLSQALDAFIKSQNHLLIVVNNFEEVVGVLSIEDVLKQIVGEQILDEFENYADPHAVARQEAKKSQEDD